MSVDSVIIKANIYVLDRTVIDCCLGKHWKRYLSAHDTDAEGVVLKTLQNDFSLLTPRCIVCLAFSAIFPVFCVWSRAEWKIECEVKGKARKRSEKEKRYWSKKRTSLEWNSLLEVEASVLMQLSKVPDIELSWRDWFDISEFREGKLNSESNYHLADRIDENSTHPTCSHCSPMTQSLVCFYQNKFTNRISSHRTQLG